MSPEPGQSGLGEGRVELRDLSRHFGEVAAVNGISADIPPGTFFALLGPSGCGKSTLLRMIAGLETPDGGSISIDGMDVTGMAPQSRPTAMVFQSYALFPSMSVGENVEYGLRVRRLPKGDRATRVAAALGLVGMGDYAGRKVTQLSGGQQQRVALARAIVVEPRVMLFDEPLSNLDVALRERTRGELRRIQRALGTTSIYVTHDQQEAMAISDLVAVMRAGELVEVGAPESLYREPSTAYVATFLGGSNIIRNPDLSAAVAGSRPQPGMALSIRSEDLVPEPGGPVPAVVRSRQFLGADVEWTVQCKGETLRVRLPAGHHMETDTNLSARSWRWVRDDLEPS